MRKNTIVYLLLFFCVSISQAQVKQFSTAGFYTLKGSQRTVESLNPGWRFTLDPENMLRDSAFNVDFDDRTWTPTALPNGLQYLPVEASGGVNYRGGAWYRKHFSLDARYNSKRLILYFEAIMGKSKIWVNGILVKEHFGGFLPISIDVTSALNAGKENLITVWCDNSNDPLFPPGKQQEMLDFCYFSGIYRDCWLIATNPTIYITDANMTDKVAGGGVFVSYPKVDDDEAIISVKCDVVGGGRVSYILKDAIGVEVAKSKKSLISLQKPHLWSPESPYLYNLEIVVKDSRGVVVDGLIKKIGIKSIQFDHYKGLILNGKEYPRKLIGANRHQDFAVIGNALSNNLHWRDAKKLKDAGMEIIRNAHYPQDPAFMDACDELGLFVIVNTPGWQFWNDEPIFGERVYSDIRNMIRRDRNRASVLMWEPILNETWYPDDFALNVHNIVKQEMPGAYTSCDQEAKGSGYFDVIFMHPDANDDIDTTKVYFTREFGDNVDDWNSHNSTSRVARQWGEMPQLIQAMHYAKPSYDFTSIDKLMEAPKFHFGGTLWHSFDHQRGYHPDPFYGGIMDAFRRPKFSYEMFKAQAEHLPPMVFIANEMTPFSPEDVTVFTNCHSVRLHTYFGDTLRLRKRVGRWITFEKAFNFMQDKALARSGKHDQSYILAEALNENGEVVATDKRMMARRAAKINLFVDTLGAAMVADGSDLAVVVAQITDEKGNIKRLNNTLVKFTVSGPAMLIGTAEMQTNPVPVHWGEASILLRASTVPGDITIRASLVLEGDVTPLAGEVTIRSSQPEHTMIFRPQDVNDREVGTGLIQQGNSLQKRLEIERQLKVVEQQQEAFGEKKN